VPESMRDKVVVITGASGGVGRCVARLLARKGARLGLLARGRDGLEGARREVEQLGGQAVVCSADVSNADQVEAAAQAVEEHFGPIDVWVNNAMVSMYSPFTDMTPAEFRHVVEVTLLGQVYGTHAALRRMIPRNAGVIISVGSALAYRSIPLQSAYCASKHGIEGFVESIRCELIHDNINVRVSMVHLPGVNTTQFSWTKNKMPNKVRPTGPIYQPELAADAILFAIENERRQVFLGYPTVEAVVGEKLIPGFLDKYLAHAAWEGAMLPEPADPNHHDNFWEPVPGDQGAHGPFDDQAHTVCPQLWLTQHRNALLAAGTAALAGAGLAWWSGRFASGKNL
jgi:short-subunit dehydrogenase